MALSKVQSFDPTNFDVVFIGGGPVSLWTAVQAKLQNKDLQIVILEKDESYHRIHNLFLEADALKTDCKDPELQRIITEFKKHYPISTHVMVTSLAQLAEKIGIVIKFNSQISNPVEDLKPFTHAHLIVGADGAHSITRETVCNAKGNDGFKHFSEMHYIADLTYTEEKEPIGLFNKISINSTVGNCIYEIHSNKRNTTTLRTFITAEQHTKMKEASRKNPLFLNSETIDQSLRNEFMTFLNDKYDSETENYIDLSKAKVSTTTLGTYISKKFVRRINSKLFCLVGDAAFGVPFFRSLNNGFLCGTYLANVIATNIKPIPNASSSKFLNSKKTFKDYESWAQNLASNQVLKAKVKSFFVNFWINISQFTHSSISKNYLSSAELASE